MDDRRLQRRKARLQRELAELLRKPLVARGWTQRHLARRVGHERSAVSRALSGRRGPLELVRRIAEEIGADTEHACQLWSEIAGLRRQLRRARRPLRPPQGSAPHRVRSHEELIAA